MGFYSTSNNNICAMGSFYTVGFKSGAKSTGLSIHTLVNCRHGTMVFLFRRIKPGNKFCSQIRLPCQKIVFRVSTLPIIKILASSFVHIILVLAMMLVFSCYYKFTTLYYFQIIYFYICTFILILGISWMTSTINIFVKDI